MSKKADKSKFIESVVCSKSDMGCDLDCEQCVYNKTKENAEVHKDGY